MDKPDLTLYLGGTRSGKSARAEARVFQRADGPVLYVATAEARPDDPSMTERIRRHRARRFNGIEHHEGLRRIIGVVSGLEVAGHDVVGGTVEKFSDAAETFAHLGARPELARDAERVAEHHAGKRAGNAVLKLGHKDGRGS